MNVIDFIRESANFMVDDRPDVYSHESAVEELTHCIDTLREFPDKPLSLITFTSYCLMRFTEDDVEEFILSRKLSSVVLFGEEEQCDVYSHHPGLDGIPNILDDESGL